MRSYLLLLLIILIPVYGISQDRTILVPKPVPGSPFKLNDKNKNLKINFQ